MLRGIRRLFTFIAALWLIVAGLVWATSPSPNHGSEGMTILIEVAIIWAIGPAITFLARGFQTPKNRIIDVTPGWKRPRG